MPSSADRHVSPDQGTERRTPLAADHEALGAVFVDFAGWWIPVRYSSDPAEHHVARTAAGVFDLSHMGEIEVSGPEAAEALDHALAGAPSGVRVGRARYSLLCATDGGMPDDLVVYRLDPERFLPVVNAVNVDADMAHLVVRAEGFDVEVTDRSPETATTPRTEDDMSVLDTTLEELDPAVATLISRELHRQQDGLEMIASENHAPRAVMQAQGSVLTNKYAEGYPGRRYYGGCEHVDEIEKLAIERITTLFGARYANVQPHSGAQANAATMQALIKPGDTILGLSLAHGGHLTHGMRLNFSGLLYRVAAYEVSKDDLLVDMDEVARRAAEHRPKVIIAGWSAYARHLDFARFRRIADEVGAYLMVDMAHFAGLVATGLYPSPVPHAHVTTSTTHKTLGGPRGGLILTDDPALAKKINSAVFPGQQGGPLQHVIAGKAAAFRMAGLPEFGERMRRTVDGARIVAERLGHDDLRNRGVSVVTGGTDVHLVLVDLSGASMDGQQAEDRLAAVDITVNRNAVPFDPRPPMITSGLRIGTAALASRGFDDDAFATVADIIARALVLPVDLPAEDPRLRSLRDEVRSLARSHPLYAELG